jgi:hypothetical protein
MPAIDLIADGMLTRAEARQAVSEYVYQLNMLDPDAFEALDQGHLSSSWIIANVRYHVDHRVSAAEHWSSLGGNDANDLARNRHSTESSNLQWITEHWNTSKGSVTSTGARAQYVNWVGPNFESSQASSSPGSLTIDGASFLDASGKPLV